MANLVGLAGDELAQQGKCAEPIRLYEQVKADDPEYSNAKEGITNCKFQLGEIEFNAKNWEKATAIYEKAGTSEGKEIAACNFQLGEVECNAEIG